MESLGTNLPRGDHAGAPIIQERRRHVRHKVHTPAYVSLDEKHSGMVLDLSEVVNICEDGISIQTSSPLHVNQHLSLCLDLSETNTYIHTTGEVIWLDRSGRAGIRFPNLADPSLGQLKQWLFANAVAACVHHEQDSASHGEASTTPETQVEPAEDQNTLHAALPDHTSVLAALAAVQREVESCGANLDAALQLLAERAHSFVGASGAAIALSQGEEMVCCGSSGEAPPVGSRLQVGSGFSGECVRTGKLLRCEDTEFDPIVDRESCQALGIRSMVAVPVLYADSVVGLLEVFSPTAYAFTENDNVVLQRLAEMVLAAVREATRPLESRPGGMSAEIEQSEMPLDEDAFPRHSSTLRRVLIVAGVAAVGVILTWSFAPSSRSSASNVTPPAVQNIAASPAPKPSPAATTLEGLRQLAEHGDPVAQFALGARYATGDQVKQDYSEAVRWFSRAAEQGHIVAQATLGAYYWSGRGVPRDLSKAYFWSILAQAGGDEASKYRVKVLMSLMNRSQVIAAQEQANDWIRQHQRETASR